MKFQEFQACEKKKYFFCRGQVKKTPKTVFFDERMKRSNNKRYLCSIL